MFPVGRVADNQWYPIRIKHLVATMLQRLVDPGELRLNPSIPRELLAAAEPILGQ